jgi:hypothetical protein
MRKAVTIIFSFYLFAKPFTLQYVWAGLVILVAIYLNVYSKNRRQFDTWLAEWWANLSQQLQQPSDNGDGSSRSRGRKSSIDDKKLLIQV